METIIFLHGALNSKAQFNKLIDLLPAENQYIAFDFSGYGNAKLPTTQVNSLLHHHLEQLTEIIDNQQQPITLIGYSYGGYVALMYGLKHPERIQKIVTINTKLDWNEEIALKECGFLDYDKMKDKIPQFITSLEREHLALPVKEVLEITKQILMDIGRNNYLNITTLSKLTIQTLMVVSELDKTASPDFTKNSCLNISTMEVIVLPNTPHPFDKIDLESLKEVISVV
jgi:pimeloyl-ACP methyl ester carboxylesterase